MCGRIVKKYLLGDSHPSRLESSQHWHENLIFDYKSFALPAERWCVELVLWWMLFCYIREFELSLDTCDLTVQKQ
jgi:hypothetical protein